MPLAFGAHAGSLLMLTGSPVNLVIADYAEAAGVGPFGLFAFAAAGVPLVLATIIVVVALWIAMSYWTLTDTRRYDSGAVRLSYAVR